MMHHMILFSYVVLIKNKNKIMRKVKKILQVINRIKK